MNWIAARNKVLNRGRAPLDFLAALVDWAKDASPEIFLPNPNPADVYALVAPKLGPFHGNLDMRRAAMLEVMRVHAGFESSWTWSEGVDMANQSSQHHIEMEETGIFQVSFDSLKLGHRAMLPYAQDNGIDTAEAFIRKMKSDHRLAIDYYARLVRVSIEWAGPLVSRKILPLLDGNAMAEFQTAVREA